MVKKTRKQFREALIQQSNRELLETVKNKSWYRKEDVAAVEAEIKRRKASGKMRTDAGSRRNATRQKRNDVFGGFGFFR